MDELVKEEYLVKEGNIYKKKELKNANVLTSVEQRLLAVLENSGATPDAPYNIYEKLNIDRKVGDNAMKRLTSAKKVVRLAHNIFVATNHLVAMVQKMKDIIKKRGYIDVKVFKEEMPMSRKYIVAYLDYLDNLGDIEKIDNKRYLKNS
jgi:selenocysteine-specific elongation factor